MNYEWSSVHPKLVGLALWSFSISGRRYLEKETIHGIAVYLNMAREVLKCSVQESRQRPPCATGFKVLLEYLGALEGSKDIFLPCTSAGDH